MSNIFVLHYMRNYKKNLKHFKYLKINIILIDSTLSILPKNKMILFNFPSLILKEY